MRDGDKYEAATLQAELNSVRDAMSDIPASAVEPQALRLDHLPSIWAADLFPNGYTSGYALNTSYEAVRAGFRNGMVYSPGPDMQTFSEDSSHPVAAPYGAQADPLVQDWDAGTATAGWIIPAYNGVLANACSVSTTTFNMDTERLKGVLVQGTVELGYSNAGSAPYCVILGVGWRDGSGDLHCVEDSVVAFTSGNNHHGALQIGWFLTQDDLDAGDGSVQEIFLCLSSGEVSYGAHASLVAGVGDYQTTISADIGSYWISCLPIHAGDLT